MSSFVMRWVKYIGEDVGLMLNLQNPSVEDLRVRITVEEGHGVARYIPNKDIDSISKGKRE